MDWWGNLNSDVRMAIIFGAAFLILAFIIAAGWGGNGGNDN